MTIFEIQTLLHGQLVCGEELGSREVHTACGSDLMSDVLAFGSGHDVLITGLVNPQVVRTAEMLDVQCIVFARGKQPTEQMIEMARERDIAMITTPHRMLSCCGLLYEAGIRGEG